MRLVLLSVLLTACSASGMTGAMGAVGLLIAGWLILMPRGASGEAGIPPDMAADAGVDARADAVPDGEIGPCLSQLPPTAEACLCIAQPGAALPETVSVPGFDPLAVRARVLAALPPDMRARLED